MFWRFGGYANVSTIDTLLDKPDVTLEELLDEPDLIQELKQHNTKLIEYLRDENVLNRLLNYVVAPGPSQDNEEEDEQKDELAEAPKDVGSKEKAKGPARDKSDTTEEDEQKEEKARLKYSYVACEVLSSETWSILESLMVNHQHLKEFWSFMRRPPSLDPLQAGYFTKVNETLLEKKTEDMLEFFKSLDGIVHAILQHVDSPMVMDLLLKIISLEKAEGGQGIVDWLQSQGLIPVLLSYLSPDYPSSTQTSAGDFLKAIITISANASQNEQSCIGPNSLTRQLVSESCMETLITSMLRGGNPLTVGVGIVIEVIRKNNSDYDPDVGGGQDGVPSSHDPIYLGTLLRMFAKHVPDFMDLILSSKHTITDGSGSRLVERGQLKSAWGIKIEPLGFDRFKTCELMAELLHCSNMGLLNERGSEEYVRQRDAERERLKAEGTLNAKKEGDSGVQYAEDTTGFTNGVSSPLAGGSPEEIRRFEIANAGDEDGFEDVAASGVLNDEIKDDFDEKSAEKDSSSSEAFTTIQDRPRIDLSDEFMDEPLSSPKLEDKMSEEDVPSPLQPADPTSPTTSGLTEKVRRFSLEKNDSPMTSEEDQPEETKPGESSDPKDKLDPVSPGAISPRPEDTPAPLFASSSGPPREEAVSPKAIEGEQSGNSIDTTLGEGGDSSTSVIMSGNEQLFEPHIETDIDGKPVVGDFLKVMFVENRVVPTILSFFFRFPWNNFLHNVVYDVVQQVFNGPMDRGYNRSLAIDLFDTGRITDQIIEGQQRSDEAQANKNMRLGYMGHLTLVAEEVVKFSERHPAELLSQSVLDRVLNRQWIDYVEQTLSETRERDNAILGGVRPDMSVGPRQAVLNAVSAAQGFSLANAGLNGGGNAGAGGLDTIDLANSGSASSGPFSTAGGSSLLSGFGSSSDDEDEDMEEGDEDESRGRSGAGVGVNVGGEGETSDTTSSTTASGVPLIPPPPAPLNIHNPSRARRQLAARLAMHKQRQAEGTLDEDGSADAGDGASPDKDDAEAEAEAEDDETVFPPADGVGDASPTGKPGAGAVTATSKGMGLGGVGRGFASLFSSSGSGSGSSSKNNNVRVGGLEEDDDTGSPRRGEGTGTDDSEEDGEEGEGTDDDDSLLKSHSAGSGKGLVSIGFSGGIHTSPLPMASGERLPPPSEFEDEDDEMGELVGPETGKMDDANSSDEDVVAQHAREEANSSDEEGHPVLHPLRMGGAKDEELVPRPLGSPTKGKSPAAMETKRAAEDSPDDDDDDGLVEIMMGHGRTGSGDGKIALGINKLGSGHGRTGSGDTGAKGIPKGKGKESERKRASLG